MKAAFGMLAAVLVIGCVYVPLFVALMVFSGLVELVRWTMRRIGL